MRKFHDVEQNTEAWQSLRLGKATASNFGTFMANYGKAFGDPAHRYALQIALERLTGKKAEHGFSNDHMERGHEQEPIARMLYADETFCDVTNGGFFDCGEHGDSPDGLIRDEGVVEFKSVIASTHYATMQRGSFDPAYKWQLIGHLDCTGRAWVDFVSFCSDFPEGNQLFIHRLHRHECADELEMLAKRRAEFLSLITSTMNNISQRIAA